LRKSSKLDWKSKRAAGGGIAVWKILLNGLSRVA